MYHGFDSLTIAPTSFKCSHCNRFFTTERGRKIHTTAKHKGIATVTAASPIIENNTPRENY